MFTDDLPTLASKPRTRWIPFADVTGFPGLGLLRILRPTPAASADDGPSRRPPGRWPGRGLPGRFPTFNSRTVRRDLLVYGPALKVWIAAKETRPEFSLGPDGGLDRTVRLVTSAASGAKRQEVWRLAHCHPPMTNSSAGSAA